MVGMRPQIRWPVRWPVSVAVEEAGFVDSFRAVFPDPAHDPGLTWPAGRPDVPGWDPGPNAPHDRIDLIYAAGPAEATLSQILGERGAFGIDDWVSPWPSDHRAVVSTFDVEPATPPEYVAPVRRLLPLGAPLEASFHADTPGGRVVLVAADGDPATDPVDAYELTDATDGVVTFLTDDLAAGAYELVLLDAGGSERSRAPVWLKEPGTGPVVATDEATYEVGEPIGVTWTNAPGDRWDWVGIYRRGRDPRVRSYLLWAYTGSSVAGSVTLDASAPGGWPLPAGRYSVYLLEDDGYRTLARGDFEIVDP
jgi:hypothetical protein